MKARIWLPVFPILLWLAIGNAGASSYTITDLGTLSGGGNSVAYDINNVGQIVGFSVTVSGECHACLWQTGSERGW